MTQVELDEILSQLTVLQDIKKSISEFLSESRYCESQDKALILTLRYKERARDLEIPIAMDRQSDVQLLIETYRKEVGNHLEELEARIARWE